MRRHRISVLAVLAAGIIASPQSGAFAADSIAISSVFSQLTTIPALANPSVIVLDEKSGEVVYESNSKSARKPASVIKLLSATAAYTYLNPSDSYTTTLSAGIDGKSVVINGSLDPWVSDNVKLAETLKRTSLQRFEFNALGAIKRMNSGITDGTTIFYNQLYTSEVNHIKRFLRERGVTIAVKPISEESALSKSGKLLLSSTSPTLETIIDWTLTWSDNVLAERIARLASLAAGNTLDEAGVAKTFKTILDTYGISTSNLVVKDASGLSKENRVTASQIAKLLMVIYHDPKFAKLINGLPVGGVSGTLQKRFIETAPTAVGLVRAKTGTLNGTTNLAGFVESGDHEYIFVILADRHSKSYSVTQKVRATVDRILGKIATPLLPPLLPIAPLGETVTTTN